MHLAAAGTLAILTIGVFATLRDYGPEATVRRFHQAAYEGDWAKMQRLSTSDASMDALRGLQQRLTAYAQAGATVRVRRVDRSNSQGVVAEFVYFMPGRVEALFWVVRRTSRGWRVSPNEMAGISSPVVSSALEPKPSKSG